MTAKETVTAKGFLGDGTGLTVNGPATLQAALDAKFDKAGTNTTHEWLPIYHYSSDLTVSDPVITIREWWAAPDARGESECQLHKVTTPRRSV
ncbi:MAG: hypothetical protein ACRDOL_32210, partial [Streptosporangiaceae bacterium]